MYLKTKTDSSFYQSSGFFIGHYTGEAMLDSYLAEFVFQCDGRNEIVK